MEQHLDEYLADTNKGKEYMELLETGRVESEGVRHQNQFSSLVRMAQDLRSIKNAPPGRTRRELLPESKGGFDRIVGTSCFPYDRDGIEKAILTNNTVVDCIASLAMEGKHAEAVLKKEAKAICHKLLTNLESELTFSRMFYAANGVLNQYYQGIHVHQQDWANVKPTVLKAERESASIILLPSHKSHVDYIVLAYAMYRLGLQPFHIAAGDNLNIPLGGKLLQNSGAFFIRRSFHFDKLYKTIVDVYVGELLSRGHNLEFFLEGSRSRTGKLLTPKTGLLSMIMRSIANHPTKTAYLVPVSIAYDKVLESQTYTSELSGAAKVRESLSGVMQQATKLFNPESLGRILIRMDKPICARTFLETRSYLAAREHMKRTAKQLPSYTEKELKYLIKNLAYRVLESINAVGVITPTSLVATTLLATRGRAIGRREMTQRVDWLRSEIIRNGGNVARFSRESTANTVDRAMQALKPNVKIHMLLEPVFEAVKRFELSYYRNAIDHIFVSQALIAVTLFAWMRRTPTARHVREDALLPDLKFLSQLLKLDFIFKTHESESHLEEKTRLEKNTVETITQMFDRGTLQHVSKEELEAELLSTDLGDGQAHAHDDGNDQYRYIRCFDARDMSKWGENFTFLCMLIWPFVENYWLASMGLLGLINKPLVPLQDFKEHLQTLAKTLFRLGHLNYEESVSTQGHANALRRFHTMDVVEMRDVYSNAMNTSTVTRKPARAYAQKSKVEKLVSKAPTRLINLAEAYRSRDKLRTLIDQIGVYRAHPIFQLNQSDVPARVTELTRARL